MIRASHILVAVNEDASHRKQAQALEKILELRQTILDGQTFASVAKNYSDDPTIKESGPDLGYFTVFEQLYPIETAAFETPVGAISQPVKTRFGYHIIQTTERVSIKKRKGVAHLLVKDSSSRGYQKILTLAKMLNDISFESLVKNFSDDPLTKTQGGELGFDRLINPLEKTRLLLGLNQVSKPIQSSQGWHLIKVTELREMPSFQNVRQSLRHRIHLDQRVERILEAISRNDSLYPVAISR